MKLEWFVQSRAFYLKKFRHVFLLWRQWCSLHGNLHLSYDQFPHFSLFFSYFPFSSRVNKCNPSAPGCEHVSHSPILFRHTLGIIRTHSTRPQRIGPYWKIHGLFSTGDHSFTCTITGKTIHILDTSWKPSASCSKCQQPTSSTHLGVGISCTYVTDEPKSQKGVQDKHNNKLLWAFPPHFLTMLY